MDTVKRSPLRTQGYGFGLDTYGSEAEVDSESEDSWGMDGFEDAEAILASCLGELDSIMGLEQVGGSESVPPEDGANLPNGLGGVTRREKLHPPRTDAHRLSRANLEESGDLELDAILLELCALENQFNLEISPKSPTSTLNSLTQQHPTKATSEKNSALQNIGQQKIGNLLFPVPQSLQQMSRLKTAAQNGINGGLKSKTDPPCTEADVASTNTIARTDSPDNDSAFSDNVSMLSSESSASSGASAGGAVVSKRPDPNRHVGPVDQAAKIKAEKIKMALEKLKEANVKKLFIKAFSQDNSSKSLLVDEKMTVAQVCRMLADKNHVRIDPKWTIIEQLPDLYLERIYEDDEMLVENLLLWTRDSKNKVLFLERPDKYDLFFHPENYLLYGGSPTKPADIDDESRSGLLEEFFSSNSVPEVEGPLFLKSEGKKAWKKFYFVLRQSGLYYCPKGKSSRSSKDLVCLTTLENNQAYQGFGWKKKFKAPTDWGFALKPPHLQAKSSKHIKYLCAEDPNTFAQWIMGIRIAKHGQKLLENYRCLLEEIAQDDIDMLASSRSFSLASVTGGSRGQSEATTPSSESRSLDSCLAPSLSPSMVDDMDDIEDNSSSAGSSSQDTPVNTLSRAPEWRHEGLRSGASSSSSSGCLSERSSTGTPTGEHGFEADFPQQGTIKRKPSSNPKIPLTSTTRHLVKEVDVEVDGTAGDILSPSRNSTLRLSTRKSLTEEVSSLRRRNSSTATHTRTSVSSGFSSIISTSVNVHSSKQTYTSEHQVDSFPIPPPPPEFGSNFEVDLPPPPPELLASTLSLNSLPPPPDESTLPIFSDELMSSSITSLPPPPSPVLCHLTQPCIVPGSPTTPPKPMPILPISYQPSSPPAVAPKPRKDVVDGIYASRRGAASPIEQGPLPSINGWHQSSPSPPPPVPPPLPSNPPPIQKSPQKRVKKITFLDDVQHIPPSPSPPYPSSPSKPPMVPKRTHGTRLSQIPGKLDSPGCKVTPPRSFLNNLQRVMQKKWQVAQKCRDFDKTPHEVLGFRDPFPQREAERNVGAWIQEHYGMLYENLSPNNVPTSPLDSPTRETQPPVGGYLESVNTYIQPPPSSHIGVGAAQFRLSQSVPGRKRTPPLPPKRAETTQLSVRQ